MARGAHSRKTARLMLESFESREAPSGFIGPAGPGLNRQAIVANQAPTITDFKAIVGPNGQVTFVGTVADDQAVAGYVVRITGDGVDVTAVVQRDGTFSVTTQVYANHDVTVAATVTDSFGLTSAPAYTTFTPSA
jgi:hypothetical protein